MYAVSDGCSDSIIHIYIPQPDDCQRAFKIFNTQASRYTGFSRYFIIALVGSGVAYFGRNIGTV